jgi:hypothetical protein
MRNIIRFGSEQQVIDILPIYRKEVVEYTDSKTIGAEKQRINRIRLEIAKQFTKQSDVYAIAAKLELSDAELLNRFDPDATFNALKMLAEKVDRDIQFTSRQTTREAHEDVYMKTIAKQSIQRDIKKALEMYRNLVQTSSKSLNSKHNRFQAVRKELAERFGDTSPIYNFARKQGLTREEAVLRQQEMDEARVKRLGDKKQTDSTSILNSIKELQQNESVYDQLIALQLASGTRFIELIKSTFKPGTKENEIIVQDLAKKQKGTSERPVIGMSVSVFLMLLEQVREKLASQYDVSVDNKTITTTITPPVNRKIKSLELGDHIKSTNDLRKIYSEMAWMTLPEEMRDTMDKDAYTQKLFVHERIDTAKSYANVHVRKQKKNVVQDDEKKEEPKMISLINMEGQSIEFPRHTRKFSGTLDAKLKGDVERLNELKVKITRKVLRQIGYGAAIINDNKDYIAGFRT